MPAIIVPEHNGQAGGPEVVFFDTLPEGNAGFCLNHALHEAELHFQTATVSVRSALLTPAAAACESEREGLEVEVAWAALG